jgi:metal-responsive CopG/Arc/MetJ family transcriptional regulator
MKRVIFSLPDDLLEAIDQEAKYNCMTRSNLMRQALVSYLRPAARASRQQENTDDDKLAELYTDPEELLKILQQQKLRASVKAMLRDAKKQRARRNNSK